MKKNYLGIALLFLGGLASAQTWQTAGGKITSNAGRAVFAVDGSGNIYVAYDNMMNAWMLTMQKWDGKEWNWVGNPDFSTGPAKALSVAVDNTGTPFVVYRDMKRQEKAIVQKFDGKDWVVVGKGEISTGYVNGTSIAFDKQNTPYVAYTDQKVGKLSVLKFVNNDWVELPSPFDATGDQVTIAFDKSNALYVCYADTKIGNKAIIKKFDGTAWKQLGTTPASEKETAHLSFALDGNSVPYIAFKNTWDGKILAKKFDGTAWINVGEPVIGNGNNDNVSLAIDSKNTPWVGYLNTGNFENKTEVKKFDGSKWSEASIVGKGGVGYVSIGVYGGSLYTCFREDDIGTVVKKAE